MRMIFHQLVTARLNSIADCLDSQFDGIGYDTQNPADKGELAELFIKEVLGEILVNQFDAVRGGKIVDIEGTASAQLDVLLTGKSALRLFRDKGLYPIGTVFGVISVKSTLNTPDFKKCLAEFKLPNKRPQFDLFTPCLVTDTAAGAGTYESYLNATIKQWRSRCPYKILFAFKGNISEKWRGHLTELVETGAADVDDLPDLIIVNKRDFILKSDETREPPVTGFELFDCKEKTRYRPFRQMLTDIHNLMYWDRLLMPDYQEYVNYADEIATTPPKTKTRKKPVKRRSQKPKK